MSELTKLFYDLTGITPAPYYLETGCYEGKNLESIINRGNYREYHSIELSPEWHEYNSDRFSRLHNVFIHLGDSSTVLEKFDFSTAKTIFLDAHYSGPGTAHGKMETPLLEELSVLAKSILHFETVIIIDDIRMLGIKSFQPGNGKNYHAFDSDWTDITLENIKEIMGEDFCYLTNNSSWLTYGPADQLIIVKISQHKRDLMVKLNQLIK